MKRSKLLCIALFCIVASSVFAQVQKPKFEDIITVENYPIVDGSTSNEPLSRIIAAKLLGFQYDWKYRDGASTASVEVSGQNLPEDFFEKRVITSQTHQSFLNLIDKKVDIILSARKMSASEKEYAEAAGVTLIEAPIALDALVFMNNMYNSVTSLTTSQIQNIYTGNIVDWSEVGGQDGPIYPFTRNEDSGSQELMRSLVMKDLLTGEWEVKLDWQIGSMIQVFGGVESDVFTLGYTVYYYKEQIVRGYEDYVRSISVDGVYPDKQTIKNRTYPYVAEVYAIIRSDQDTETTAYGLYEWLQTSEGQDIVAESGYVPVGSQANPKFEDAITAENYPIVDGSTSNEPLSRMIAAKLLGLDYEWVQYLIGTPLWYVKVDDKTLPEGFFENRVMTSQTHQSFLNLIDKKADITLSARKMSDSEKEYAEAAGVTLIETPIALDALIFMNNTDNPVTSLNTHQIQSIYTANTTHWNEVGGTDAAISPYVRNADSGSQELMESLVMKDLVIGDWPAIGDFLIRTMIAVFSEINNNVNGLGYTVYYYKENIVRDYAKKVRTISVDGVYPDKNTIRNRAYPYVGEVYAIIRSDQDRTSTAYGLYQWLKTKAGQEVVAESGYVPIEGSSAVPGIEEEQKLDEIIVYPNPVSDGCYISGLTQPARLTLRDASGREILSVNVDNEQYIDLSTVAPGLYIATFRNAAPGGTPWQAPVSCRIMVIR